MASLEPPGQEVVQQASFQPVFIGLLLCAKHRVDCWEHSVGFGVSRPRSVADSQAGGLGQTSLQLGFSAWNMGTMFLVNCKMPL